VGNPPGKKMRYKSRIAINLTFAIAMAWVEAAVVIYLRTMVNRINPYQVDPLPLAGDLGQIELVREAATLLMLLCVGWLCGRNTRSRLAYAALAFGVWDIFYYIFLRLMGPWPSSLLDWDILFLLPLPWWGPVLAPVLIAMLLIVGGLMITLLEEKGPLRVPARSTLLALGGALLTLYVFMEEPLTALPGGIEAIRGILPTSFNWPLFLVALLLMAAPGVEIALQVKQMRGSRMAKPTRVREVSK
jgi:hypothetical protein